MSDKLYIKMYENLTDKQKDIMTDLYMKGVNKDGHTYVTYTDVEHTVALLIKEWVKKS